MSVSLSIDRLEGDDKEIAVLVGDDELTINVPLAILPAGSQPGDVVSLTFKHDAAATKRLASETKKIQDELGGSDTGEDIKL